MHHAGDSFTIGFANVGNSTNCQSSACNPISKACMPGLDTEDASLGWGPSTAGNFSADFQIIAASGSGLVTYSSVEARIPNITREEAQVVNPTDVDLFSRQVATGNGATVINYNYTDGNYNYTDGMIGWIPQVAVLSLAGMLVVIAV